MMLKSLTTIEQDSLAPIHPGEILREEFMAPTGLSAGMLAKRLAVPRTRIERLVRGEVPVTTDTALRLSRYWGTSPEFWLSLQVRHDLEVAAPRLADTLATIAPRETETA